MPSIKDLITFGTGGTGGGDPRGSLYADAQGNLYGTTFSGSSGGATFGGGTVFEIVRTDAVRPHRRVRQLTEE